MINEDNECAPEDIQHWPIWALDLREQFVLKAFEIHEPWDVKDPIRANRAASSATDYVRALYPGLG